MLELRAQFVWQPLKFQFVHLNHFRYPLHPNLASLIKKKVISLKKCRAKQIFIIPKAAFWNFFFSDTAMASDSSNLNPFPENPPPPERTVFPS
jgi:hypothetical protein